MQWRPGSEGGRRLLLAAGTARFDELPDSDLSQVPEEVARVVTTFTRLGYEHHWATVGLNPGWMELWDLLKQSKKGFGIHDVVVAYYTAHGASDDERFYLLARDSAANELYGTALPAEEFARALIRDSQALQVLVILDVCYASKGAAEITQIASRLASLGNRPAVFVLAAARPKEEAEQAALSSALAVALAVDQESLGGRTQQFLAMDDVMRVVGMYLREKHPSQTATWSSANVCAADGCQLFPNPRFRPNALPGLDLETQRAFDDHWVLKARGAEIGAAGWYFTGRVQALHELCSWLSSERSDGRARVVTGGPGSGKSAVLSRIVTLADPRYRADVLAAQGSIALGPAMLPPEGGVNVAVHARRKLLAEVTAQIATGLGLSVRSPNELLAAIESRPGKLVVILDALDEADEPNQIVSRLLSPLAKIPQVFLLIGSRPDSSGQGKRFRSLGEPTFEINLDDPRYVGVDDVTRYVERRLLAAEEPGRPTPYRGEPGTARAVAQAVAKRAANVFLVARTATQALLAEASPLDISRAGWVEQLPTGLDEAFAQFLGGLDARGPGSFSAEKARAVLRPLAFAEGEGLPWTDLWAAVATSLSGVDISDTDIALVRKYAAAFIVEAVEHDRSVYRLYHERLAEHLRGSPSGRNLKQSQQAVVEALLSRVPKFPTTNAPDWSRAAPYLLAHLSTHALSAGVLGALVTNGTFIAYAEPDRLRQSLSASADPLTHRVYVCYMIAFDRICGEPAGNRMSYLILTARQQGDDSLARLWERTGLSRSWAVPWARWLPLIPHRTIPTPPESVQSITLGEHSGQAVAVSGGTDGTVRIWNLASGTQYGDPLRGHYCEVTSVAVATVEERPVIFSGGWDATVRMWDLASGECRAEPQRGDWNSVTSIAVGTLEGRSVIVWGDVDGMVWVWDLALREPRGEPLLGHRSDVNSVAIGVLDGKPVIVSGGEDATIRMWDLASGASHGQPLLGHDGAVNAVTVGSVEGRPVIVSGGDDGTVRVWDLASGVTMRKRSHVHDGAVNAVAVGMLEGRPVVVSGGEDGTVQVQDLSSRAPRGAPLRGHDDEVRSVAMCTVANRPVIVSSGDDQTLRLWDIASSKSPGNPRLIHDLCLNTIAVSTLNGRPVIVSGEEDGTIQVWDLKSGMPRGEPMCGHEFSVNAVAVGEIKGRSVIVSGGSDGTVRVWDLASGAPCRKPLYGHHGCVSSVAVCTFRGRLVIVSGGYDRTVRLWDLKSGAQLGELGHCDADVYAISVGMLKDQAVIASGGENSVVRVWSLSSEMRTAELFAYYHGDEVTSVAVGTLQDRPVIVSAGDDVVRAADVGSARPFELFSYWHRGVNSVTVGTLRGHRVVVSGSNDGTVFVTDAEGTVIFRVSVGDSVNSIAAVKPAGVVVAGSHGLLLLQLGKQIAR